MLTVDSTAAFYAQWAMASLSFNLSEAHFVSLPSQSNIYGLATLCVGGTNKILVASLRRQVISVEYVHNKPYESLVPASKEVHFTYIPGGAEIISIDSFNKSLCSNDFIVGITFSKPSDSPAVQYLNIYTDWEPKAELSLESIAQSCLSLKLNFIPYQLYHTEIWKGENREIVFLLSGSDGEIHLYQEDKAHHTYYDQKVDGYFPEFVDLKRIVLWMDVCHFGHRCKRLTAVGCEDGYIRATVTQVNTNEILHTWEVKHDSPIACVKIFQLNTAVERPTFLQHTGEDDDEEEFVCGGGCSDDGTAADTTGSEFHLLVVSTLEVAVVYWNVLVEGFEDQRILIGSEGSDCVQCACIADIDMDCNNEIILGTYGQEVLIYKYDANEGTFTLSWKRSFAYPVLSIDYLDITGDGLRELVVLSTKGLHILQHDLNEIANLLTERLSNVVRHLNKNDAFKELQSEQLLRPNSNQVSSVRPSHLTLAV